MSPDKFVQNGVKQFNKYIYIDIKSNDAEHITQ